MNPMSREERAIALLQSALAYFEMPHDRAVAIRLPDPWLRAAHQTVYGDDWEVVYSRRVEDARKRRERVSWIGVSS